MLDTEWAYQIRINDREPSSKVIAEDLAACGGHVLSESHLTYGFRTPVRRDLVLKFIRGTFGATSAEPMEGPDADAPASRSQGLRN